ncbi:VOC family protein [Alkalihalobacillus sp. CinArs1]|uniref:VOC family protein n=1 Tax=Alkalihalobacillus sp. CinArs1 TaxID=2995314 RepID=UPI0022DE8C5B|nr:VOC family protein [Alkalihalobacillus sp. CinArs1]
MALQVNQVYLNLPVKDLDRSVSFFTELGFEFNAEYTDDKATCMVINDNTYIMLLVEEYFKTFTKKEVVNAKDGTEAIVAISVSSREEVDRVVEKALNSGGKASSDPVDHGFMYASSFQDPDGHIFEVLSMEQPA